VEIRKVLASLTFRYIAKYLLVLTGAVFLLVAAIYAFYSYSYFRDLSTSIVNEEETLQLIYRGQGLPGLEQYLIDQRENWYVDRFHYLVRDSGGRKLGGDLPSATAFREFEDGWLGFELSLLEWGREVDAEFLARDVALSDDYYVIVARSYREAVERGRLVLRTLLRTMAATILLGLIGGVFAASRSLERVEWINREMARIVRGDPSQRLDVSQEKGQVRELAKIMNQMLDQTESLMQGVRSVSDNIAHDLRTPLSRLRNQLSGLRSELPDDAVDEVDQLIVECDALLASFNAVLRISTLEAGSRYSGAARVDLSELVQDVVELYEPVAQEKDIALASEMVSSASCPGEADLLFQMLANVVDNAIKYTPSGGRVDVRLSRTADGHLVEIADSGPGISAEHWQDVFRRFYRVEPSRSTQPGHGLGLSMAQAIAHYHGGGVDLQDNHPGLRVILHLP
jgi:signal transduction histidine kinase